MQARLDPRKAAPDATKAMSNLHAYVGKCRLDRKLIELIKLRASQIKAHLAVGAGCVTPWASRQNIRTELIYIKAPAVNSIWVYDRNS